nr:RecQ family ATP-dependent DNA helicase [uncultured Agathobaculum sp.]
MNKNEALTQLGLTALRPAQEQTLQMLEQGRDVLAILATGSGKSAIFQMFALELACMTIVIEPFLALEIDQVRQLQEKGIAAAMLNSTLSKQKRQEVLSQIENNTLRLLYLTPEMLQNQNVQKALNRTRVSGVMIDEAHCIVKQGPGFRENYLRIADFVKTLREKPVIGAFTATATRSTEKQIINRLNMDDPFIYRGSVTRENIRLSAIEVGHGLKGRKNAAVIEQRKREEICRLLKRKSQKGNSVIYCNTVKRVKQIKRFLKKEGFPVESFYGACKNKEERLRRFASGEVRIMVATNAFGLGVNIPNVRLVIHHSPSIGLDEYVQEAGRAGRNGKQAEAALLWHPYDFTINRGLLEKAKMDLTGRERKDRLDALEALKRYAQDKERCRWRIIRKFFGEKKGDRCEDQCDNCYHAENKIGKL